MKPEIDKTEFGSITIDGEKYVHDILIRLNGKVKKRKKKLSRAVYGTSHILSLAEAEFVYEDGTENIIIGTGQESMLKLSDEAERYFKQKECRPVLLPTPEAIHVWNAAKGRTVGLFHITC